MIKQKKASIFLTCNTTKALNHKTMKNIQFQRASTSKELQEIITLQQQNLSNNITAEEKTKEGFVTLEHTFELLQQMNNACPHCIAKTNDTVIGYALVMKPSFKDTMKSLEPMFDEIQNLVPHHKNYIIMGQICIAKAYRGLGIFKKLYFFYKDELSNQFDCLITEVASVNTRSLHAHQAVGFTTLKTYQEQDITWHIMIWEWA
jgi:hypothetical protein